MMPDALFEFIALNPKLSTLMLVSLGAAGAIGVWLGFWLELKKQKKDEVFKTTRGGTR